MVDNYTAAHIPLDTMWGDIDYMEHQRDFTFDPVNFPLPDVQARPRLACPLLDRGLQQLFTSFCPSSSFQSRSSEAHEGHKTDQASISIRLMWMLHDSFYARYRRMQASLIERHAWSAV